MRNVYHALLLLIAGWTQKELARSIRYLKIENQILRSKLPTRIPLTPREKNRLIKFGEKLGGAMKELVSIVHPDTLRRWIRESRKGKKPKAAKPGRILWKYSHRIAVQCRDFIFAQSYNMRKLIVVFGTALPKMLRVRMMLVIESFPKR